MTHNEPGLEYSSLVYRISQSDTASVLSELQKLLEARKKMVKSMIEFGPPSDELLTTYMNNFNLRIMHLLNIIP